MSALTFQLPIPAKALSPNARLHWAVKSKAVKESRRTACIEALRVLGDAGMPAPYWAKAKMRVVVFTATARRPDPGNLMASLKAYEDGFADAGVILNDRNLWPERPEFRKSERMPRVEITIEPEL